MRKFKFVFVVATLVCWKPASAAEVSPDILKSGGYTVFFRHTARDTKAMKDAELVPYDNREECVPGSQLNTQGQQDATMIGKGIERMGIPVGNVYNSPTCRTKEMARLMFGRDGIKRRELIYQLMWTADDDANMAPKLRYLVSIEPPPGKNNFMLAHTVVLQSLGVMFDGRFLDQGEAMVLKPRGDGHFEVVGTISMAKWAPAVTP